MYGAQTAVFQVRIRMDFGRQDLDPDPGGLKTTKTEKRQVLDGFSYSLGVLYGCLRISKLQFDKKY
jgi:hypothetical protein